MLQAGQLHYLDQLPESLYRCVVTHQFYYGAEHESSDLSRRCLALLKIRAYLLHADALSKQDLEGWLKAEYANSIYARLMQARQRLNLFRDNPDYTDQFILDLLGSLQQPQSSVDHTFNHPAAEPLDNQHNQGLTDTPGNHESHEVRKDSAVSHQNLPQDKEQPLESPAINAQDKRQAGPMPGKNNVQQFISGNLDSGLITPEAGTLPLATHAPQSLQTMESHFSALQPLHQHIGIERRLGWDLSQGVGSQSDIKLLLKLHAQIKANKTLQRVIALIGRGDIKKYTRQQNEGVNEQLQQQKPPKQLTDPHAVNSISGVCYADDISRMLASELSLLGHPTLKRLWHARRAESHLLSYHIQGVLSSHVPEVSSDAISLEPITHDQRAKHKTRAKGPMILCMDTSASMRGMPEWLAKAVVLETLRVAYRQSRACFLYNFSGQGELESLQLDLQQQGWSGVVGFLRRSFNGGTDINGVLKLALHKAQHKSWRHADIMIVSDGRFQVSNEIREMAQSLSKKTRIFGLQVSHWNNVAFSDICHQTFTLDHVH